MIVGDSIWYEILNKRNFVVRHHLRIIFQAPCPIQKRILPQNKTGHYPRTLHSADLKYEYQLNFRNIWQWRMRVNYEKTILVLT